MQQEMLWQALNAGGLVGWNHRSYVINCYATGNVRVETERAGGLIGLNLGTVINSYRNSNAIILGAYPDRVLKQWGQALPIAEMQDTCPDSRICELGNAFFYNSTHGLHFPKLYKHGTNQLLGE